MTRSVTYSAQAHHHLHDLYNWIAESGAPERAEAIVDTIYQFCNRLGAFPFIGVSREDLYPSLRTFAFRRRATIAFVVTNDTVDIPGVYPAGRDYERLIVLDLG